MRDLFLANRWLMSRLRHVKGENGKKRLVLCIEDKFCDPDQYIKIDHHTSEHSTAFKENMKYSDYKKLLNKYDTGMGKTLWDKDNGKLSNVGIVLNADKTKMIVYMVANHIIIDGATLYTLWKSLDLSQPVVRMNPERHDFCKQIETETSLTPSDCTMEEMGMKYLKLAFPAMLMKGIAQSVKGQGKLQNFMFGFDKEEIAKEKAKFKTETSFVSTND